MPSHAEALQQQHMPATRSCVPLRRLHKPCSKSTPQRRTRLLVADVDHQAAGLADGVQRQHRLVHKIQARDVERLEGDARQLLPVHLQQRTEPSLTKAIPGWPLAGGALWRFGATRRGCEAGGRCSSLQQPALVVAMISACYRASSSCVGRTLEVDSGSAIKRWPSSPISQPNCTAAYTVSI